MSSRRGRFRSSERRPQKRQLVQGSTCGPLNRVVSTFGKAGDEHDGVTISFGKTQSAKATADAHSYKDDNGLLKTDITFNSAFSAVSIEFRLRVYWSTNARTESTE
jgi:hypothetical protein